MPLYESTFIARQDLSRQDVSRLSDQYSGIIEQGGGKVVKNEYWGLRSLAYRVKKNRKGHYMMFGIDAPFEAVKEMQRAASLNEEVLRNMTVRVEEISDEPSPMMSSRAAREDSDEEASEKSDATSADNNKE